MPPSFQTHDYSKQLPLSFTVIALGIIQSLTEVLHWMPASIQLPLLNNTTNTSCRSITTNSCFQALIKQTQHWSSTQQLLQLTKSTLLVITKLKLHVFPGQECQGTSNSGKIMYKSSVIVCHAKKLLYLINTSRLRPILHHINFALLNLQTIRSNSVTQKLNTL